MRSMLSSTAAIPVSLPHTCVDKCPAGALKRDAEGKVRWASETCVQCDTCIRVCPHSASPKVQWMTVEEVLAQVKRTAPYIGGVTTSGGECTLYNEFLIELFTEVRKLNKTCLIDSNGSFDFEADPRVLDVCDGVMLDVKAVEPGWNDTLISYPRDRVLKNLDYLLKAKKLFEVRTVISPAGIGKTKKRCGMCPAGSASNVPIKSSATAPSACGSSTRKS